MIDVSTSPKNEEHFSKLMIFAQDVLAICADVGLTPILDGSLSVFAYTQDESIEVHDVDFSCSEADFPPLLHALETQGFAAKVTDWHVLQVRRDGMKVEFGATEYWLPVSPESYEALTIRGVEFVMLKLDDLRELYMWGLVETAKLDDEPGQLKHRAIMEKLRLLYVLRNE